jgi:S1-C subfamily serine protease
MGTIEAGSATAADSTQEPAGAELRYLAIEGQVAELQRRIEDLEAELGFSAVEVRDDANASPPASEASAVSAPSSEAKLVASGIDEATAEWIQQQLDRNQLDQLYLQNQASREGWLNTPRYHRQRREIYQRFDAFREELGDETFDRLLHAQGRPNRVLVSDVMQGSAAEQVGLSANDTILSYDGKRVFSTPELQALTKDGDPASWVLVELLRDGRPVSLYAPGGPLGVRLSTGRVAPQ